MFKFRLLVLLVIASSAKAMEDSPLLTWDDRQAGTGLHVFSKGIDQQNKTWTVRETQIRDTPFYQDLFSDVEVVKTLGDGSTLSLEETANYVQIWASRFAVGTPFGKMTIEQDGEAIGCVQLGQNKMRPGVGELMRGFKPTVQGKGLGKATLGFLVKEWAPAVRKVGLGQDIGAPLAAIDKFKCFSGEELKLIYTTARPSNVASWKCYKYFDFYPSQPTNLTYKISCEGWEESQHGPLEQHITSTYFSPHSSEQLQADVLYEMLDENGEPRTLSFVDQYQSLRYHFERGVE